MFMSLMEMIIRIEGFKIRKFWSRISFRRLISIRRRGGRKSK